MRTNSGEITAAAMPVVIGITINPDAAIGATFGAAFFLLSNEHFPPVKRFAYGGISLCVGYGTGIAIGAPWAMLASATGAAVAVVSLASLAKTISEGGLQSLITLWRNKR